MATLVEQIKAFVNKVAEDIVSILKDVDELREVSEDKLSWVRSNMDANGIYQTVTYYRDDGTLYKISQLSGGASPNYPTRTNTFYKTDGTSVKYTYTFTITYDANGLALGEILIQ